MIAFLLAKLNFVKVLFISRVLSANITITLQTSLISNCFVAMILFLYATTTIYSFGYMIFERDKEKVRFHFFTFLAVLSCIGLAYSANLFTAFIFYDLLSFFTYMLVRHHKDENSENHAIQYAMYLIIPSMLLLMPAIICVYNIAEQTDFIVGGILSKHPISKFYVNILFLMFIYGISKTALYPLHKWLIHAMVAPSPVSALLHAVLVVKGGLFLLYKVINETFGLEFLRQNIYTFYGVYWPIYIAGISIIIGAFAAIASENIKQRLAYSTISQIGYISMCLFCFTEDGIFGAEMQFLAHSFAKISLFYYAGYLLARYHVTNVSELRYKKNHFNVVLSMLWLIPAISLMSMPLTIGFIGKHAILFGTLKGIQDIIILAIIVLGMLLCIMYLYPILYHLILFENHNRRFTGQFWSSASIYLSVFIVAVCIVGGYFLLAKL